MTVNYPPIRQRYRATCPCGHEPVCTLEHVRPSNILPSVWVRCRSCGRVTLAETAESATVTGSVVIERE